MPASLTVQVRLGFSMGWRIWTPNEVGFYAKTLAHSYFILIILKSKFLKEMIWIVNYNLFMGTKKYHVFIEFLQFGMKSTEERCIWKKIIFISLIARHKKMTKAYFNYRDERFKLLLVKSGLAKAYPYRGDRKAVWKVYESKLFKNTRLNLKANHLKSSKKAINTNVNNLFILKKKRMPISLKKKIKIERIFVFKFMSKKSKSLNRVISKSYYFYKKYLIKKIKNNVNFKKSIGSIRKFKTYFTKVINQKHKSRNTFLKKNRDLITGISESGLFISDAEKTLMESFRFDPIFMKNKYSLFSGPRKRLSRNLRRAFKGKHVKVATDLVWFWEKISRMITYFVQRHVLYTKRLM